ncbi:MAG: DUF1934 domain-containing protein [Clostridia bacterium]|nr:DUF1934 domain-containing protein [Clostridia bacterium]
MQEEVRIKIRSVRYEVSASLFSDIDEDGAQIPLDMRDGEPETVEICTVGKLREEDGRIEVSYEETEATGMEGSVTAVSFLREQSGIITMIREGAVSTTLVFEDGKRHHCLYETPFMPFQICVHTLKVDNRLSEDRYIDLDYVIEIRGAQAERTKFRLELL